MNTLILLYLDSGQFRPYWFETGTPTFLVKLLMEGRFYIPKIEHIRAGEELLGSFDVDIIRPETLLFQTGYLTIDRVEEVFVGERIYHLRYPNLEVKRSLTDSILSYYVQDLPQQGLKF